jgi:hypothetical protein
MKKHTDDGYIILARGTYKDSKTWRALTPIQKVVMITLLFMANHTDGEWWDGYRKEFIPVKRGQLITSTQKIKQACGKGISIQNVRTSLVNLENMGFLTRQPTHQYTLITIANYDFYQDGKNYLTQQPTQHQQGSNKGLTTNNNDNNDNNDNKRKDLLSESANEFVEWFNSTFGKKHKPATYRNKLKTRLKTYTIDQLKQACLNMRNNPYMMGDNDNNTVYATLEYISRNNTNIDKWLNMRAAKKQRRVIR